LSPSFQQVQPSEQRASSTVDYDELDRILRNSPAAAAEAA
jgi:hypothetical protein